MGFITSQRTFELASGLHRVPGQMRHLASTRRDTARHTLKNFTNIDRQEHRRHLKPG